MAWACPRCTFLNQGGGADCGMCALDSPEVVIDSGPEWSCPLCTFLNPFVESSCEMCNTARPDLSELERNLPTDHGSQSAGKFKPLRAPRRSNADKEDSHESADALFEPRVSNDAHLFFKESETMSRKRKAAAVEEDTGMDSNEMDEFRGNPTPEDGDVSNRLLGEFHLQRMSRINQTMASSEIKFRQRGWTTRDLHVNDPGAQPRG